MTEFKQKQVGKPQDEVVTDPGGNVPNNRGCSSSQPYMASTDSENSHLTPEQLGHPDKTPGFVYLLTFFSAIGGFLFGYDTGVISGAMILLQDQFHLNSVWQEMIVGVMIGASALFALVGGVLNDQRGRKPVILVASVVFMVGAVCMALASTKEVLLIGRIITGAAIGLASVTVPMYIAECSPANQRGLLVTLFQLQITSGILVSAIIDGLFSGDYKNGWRFMLGLGGVPALIQFIGVMFMPESPHWLVATGHEDKARLVLQMIRDSQDIESELKNIQQMCQEERRGHKDSKKSFVICKMLRTPSVRRALVIGCGLQMFQQLTGINTVLYYSASIIKMSGLKSGSSAIWLGAVIAAVNFLCTFFGIYLVDKIGRRPLLLVSLIGVIASLVWLAIGFNLVAIYSPEISYHETVSPATQCNTYGPVSETIHIHISSKTVKDTFGIFIYKTCDQCMTDLTCGFCYLDSSHGPIQGSCLPTAYDDYLSSTHGRCNTTKLTGKITWAYDYCPTTYAWMPMLGLILFLVFFAPGMGPMPWTINSEIYPLWARSTGNAAATFTNWISNLVISISFLSLTEAITRYGAFWLYACISIVGLIFLAYCLPETKGKSLDEVEGLFARPWVGHHRSENGAPFTDKSVEYVHIRGQDSDGEVFTLE